MESPGDHDRFNRKSSSEMNTQEIVLLVQAQEQSSALRTIWDEFGRTCRSGMHASWILHLVEKCISGEGSQAIRSIYLVGQLSTADVCFARLERKWCVGCHTLCQCNPKAVLAMQTSRHMSMKVPIFVLRHDMPSGCTS